MFLILPLTIMSREPDQNIQIRLVTSASFWLFFLIYCFAFYINIFVFIPELFLKQKNVLYSGLFVTGSLLIFYTQPFENLIFKKFRSVEERQPREEFERMGPPPPNRDFEGNLPPKRENRSGSPAVDFVSLVLFVVVWVAAMATKVSEQWRLSEKRAILSEADKARAELSFFKAQINPHFLFNTLNNIYSLAVSKSDHTAPSIMKLSKMMRYITEEATEDFVPLEDEVRCLENYIDLQRLRLNAKTKVDFKCEGKLQNHQIAPLILMTFVENAFKYGVSNRIDNLIEINLQVLEDKVLFYCQNQIFERNDDSEREGIGIANTRKRLEFIYSNRYDLKITNEENRFEVKLEILG